MFLRQGRGKSAGLTRNPLAKRERTVLLVGVDLSTGGGVNKVIRDLAALFSDELGFHVTVASARSNAAPTYTFRDNVQILYAERRWLGLIAYLRFLLRLRNRRFDYVLGFWPEDNIAIVTAFAFSRSKIILCEHISWFHPSKYVRLLRRILYRMADHVAVLNRTELDHYRKFLHNVSLIPNPIEPSEMDGSVSREKLIIGVGHLIPLKGFADLIEAFAQSGLVQQGWSLTIIGDGPEKEALEELVGAMGVERVGFVGTTSDLGTWYRRASIIAISSKVEVFSLVLAEGIQAGLLPVAYAADGPAFILEDYPDHLVPVGDVDQLAAALIRAAGCDRERKNASIRESLARRMSRTIVVNRWRELLS